ncbi:hypothetical protein JI664_21890 [Rhodobacter sp. NTK016B]|uniref:hypothetical protein n=1 Tax=Rhodobacter sp. NTK016B TaxID=2759676 RepID=UPI001A8EBDAB|nr:hypothetical protein [Rhodobacter sp. NTK016B]MBN8294639.1 hypothetical protein [Rhodobacter sp. NTK016B]
MKTSETVPLPNLPDGAPGRPKGRRYRQQFGVIVIAKDEAAQRELFEQFRAQGHGCKVVCT